MRWSLAVLVLGGLVVLGGCDVVFQLTAPPEPDAPAPCTVLHDEDGDGVDNSCDTCPAVANNQDENADGDDVGDACDQQPSSPGDQLVSAEYFDEPSFTWSPTDVAHWELLDGALSTTGTAVGTMAQLTLALDANQVVAHVGVELIDVPPLVSRSLVIRLAYLQNYTLCTIGGSSTDVRLNALSTVTVDNSVSGPLGTYALDTSYRVVAAGTGLDARCSFSNTSYTVSTRDGHDGRVQASLTVKNVRVRLRYILLYGRAS